MTEIVSVEWKLIPWGRTGAVQVKCPACEGRYRLDHSIATDGTVTPSLECPDPECDFHEFVQLDGWMPA